MARREWGRTCRNQKGSLCAKKRIFVYKVDSFVGFIGDEQVHAQECYGVYNPLDTANSIVFCSNRGVPLNCVGPAQLFSIPVIQMVTEDRNSCLPERIPSR
jgi:hypothetical protein